MQSIGDALRCVQTLYENWKQQTSAEDILKVETAVANDEELDSTSPLFDGFNLLKTLTSLQDSCRVLIHAQHLYVS